MLASPKPTEQNGCVSYTHLCGGAQSFLSFLRTRAQICTTGWIDPEDYYFHNAYSPV